MTNKSFTFITIITLVALLFATNIIISVPAYSTNTSYTENIFSDSQVATIDIVINESDWADLKENPLDETMYNVTVVVDGEKMSNVGMRTKGNSTLNTLANDDTTDRYSFKIDFDYYDSSKNLYGLTKLNLNNAYQDNSYMKNNLSYKIFELMEVPTPEAGFAYITINGEEWGLYETIEGIEEPYLIKNFGRADGDLYKPDGTGSDLKWLGDDYGLYTGMDLKTNKDTTDNSSLIKFLDAINNGDGTDLEKYLNVDEALRYFAVNTALANMDSYQGSMKHNYYLYEIDGVFQILPWDYNLAFGGFGGSEISIDNPTNGTLEDRPLLNILLANEEYKVIYYNYLTEVANIFTDGTLQKMIEQTTQLIEAYVEKDVTKFCTIDEFYKAVDTTGTYISTETIETTTETNNKKDFRGGGMASTDNLLEAAENLSKSILKQISGEITVTTNSMGGGGDRKMPNMNKEMNGEMMEMPDMDKEINGEMMERPERGEKKEFDGGMGKINEPQQTEEQIKAIRIQTTRTIIISTIVALIGTVLIFIYKKKRFTLK